MQRSYHVEICSLCLPFGETGVDDVIDHDLGLGLVFDSTPEKSFSLTEGVRNPEDVFVMKDLTYDLDPDSVPARNSDTELQTWVARLHARTQQVKILERAHCTVENAATIFQGQCAAAAARWFADVRGVPLPSTVY
ncbi:hypothetical protein EVAR_8268_1 [Eumeta japonica]|uniref:Uncharacterized protein n=1 Tax=Eumeta variegata TaxID=151549 RepID=A0A4C1TIT9_EUMVA|nr:hypothetical protein EVAR_8268_1 [Eumeta japonica]